MLGCTQIGKKKATRRNGVLGKPIALHAAAPSLRCSLDKMTRTFTTVAIRSKCLGLSTLQVATISSLWLLMPSSSFQTLYNCTRVAECKVHLELNAKVSPN